jgi:hypothetical protein
MLENAQLDEARLLEIVELYLTKQDLSYADPKPGDVISYTLNGFKIPNPELRKEIKGFIKPEDLEDSVDWVGERMQGLVLGVPEEEQHYNMYKHYWLELRREMFILICTDDKKYADLRKKIGKEGGRSETALVGLISAGIAASMGIAWGALVPFVALLLIAVARMSKNVFCQSWQNESWVEITIPIKRKTKKKKQS